MWIVLTFILIAVCFFLGFELFKHDRRVKKEMKRRADIEDDTTRFYYD